MPKTDRKNLKINGDSPFTTIRTNGMTVIVPTKPSDEEISEIEEFIVGRLDDKTEFSNYLRMVGKKED